MTDRRSVTDRRPVTDRFSVAGRTAVVTGATEGTGRAIAERFVDGGADVAQFLASDVASFPTGESVAPRGVPDVEETPEP